MELTEYVFEGKKMRVTEGMFVAKDVCEILDISKYRDAINNLDEDERMSIIVDTLGGPQEMTAVTESGLYALIFKSRKLEARRFRKWVTSEVLPSIRRTGQYSAAVSAAVMERALRYELNDRRDILKRIGGIMSQYGISAAAVKRLAERAEYILASSGGRPASDIPLDFWTEEGDEPEAELLNRLSAKVLNE